MADDFACSEAQNTVLADDSGGPESQKYVFYEVRRALWRLNPAKSAYFTVFVLLSMPKARFLQGASEHGKARFLFTRFGASEHAKSMCFTVFGASEHAKSMVFTVFGACEHDKSMVFTVFGASERA